MKTFSQFFLLLLLVGNLSAQQAIQLTPMNLQPSPKGNQDVVIFEKLMNALQQGDAETARQYLHEDFYILGMDSDTVFRDGYIKIWQGYAQENESAQAEGWATATRIPSGEMKGDWVMAWIGAQWTLKGSDHPIYSWEQQTAKIVDGKLKYAYHFQDGLSILMQMGYQILPPQQGDK